MRYQFVDCRWYLGEPDRGRREYLAGHVPGASFLDVSSDLSAPADDLADGGRHPLPAPDAFAAAASRAGIGAGAFVVAYDAGGGGAARLWWLLRHFGHDDVAVLDGGLAVWRGPLATGTERVEPAGFRARPRAGDTVSATELAGRLGEPGLVVVDARTPDRFAGAAVVDPVGGRIPGARNVPHTAASDIPEDVLRAEEIVVYCGSGISACVDLLALAQRGRADARLYPGSWSEWSARGLSRDSDLPG